MKWGLLFRWGSLWIGAHWSPYNRRLCVNLLPCITLWLQLQPAEPSIDQRAETRIKEFHASTEYKRATEAKAIRAFGRAWNSLSEEDAKKLKEILRESLKDDLPQEEFRKRFDKTLNDAPGFPHENAIVWIEAGNYSDRGAELRIKFNAGTLLNGFEDFWVPLSQPNGEALGWLRFSYITSVFTESVFAATGWRPAHDPAPSEQSVLPLPVVYLPEGFAPPL